MLLHTVKIKGVNEDINQKWAKEGKQVGPD